MRLILKKLKPKFLMNFAESFDSKGSNNQNLFKKTQLNNCPLKIKAWFIAILAYDHLHV